MERSPIRLALTTLRYVSTSNIVILSRLPRLRPQPIVTPIIKRILMDASLNDTVDFAALPFYCDAFTLDQALASGDLTEQTKALPPSPFGPGYGVLIGDESQYPSLQSSMGSSTAVTTDAAIPPKLGGRFSRGVLRTLKTWLASHAHHPYPDTAELESLQLQTSLNKMQITNWFANARRRSSARGTRCPTPQNQTTTTTKPLDIIPRPGTPAVGQDPSLRTPLERWVDSPPENEPATVGAIARAITFETSGTLSDALVDNLQSPHGMSSASSIGTSNSSEVSGFHSSGSQSSSKMSRPSRRRRVRKQSRTKNSSMATTAMPYQCTFCTETFRTKHDWQRHEKSLHLPLEQWVCALNGPRAVTADDSPSYCVFCSEPDPDDAHIETHHYSACQQRSLEDRTFKRKDHLSQHLRLFHNVKYADWSMSHWKESVVDIRSQCGFCGMRMTTWPQRVDHLAEHFKTGKTMADWNGEWGFDPAVLKIVESAVPPYTIDIERATPTPFQASNFFLCSPINAYELIKIEIECLIQNHVDEKRRMPTSDDLQLEACRIIFASDASSDNDIFNIEMSAACSWLKDLFMSSTRITRQARFGPLRLCSEGRLPKLMIKGQNQLFEQCPLERQLVAFVEAQKDLEVEPSDQMIQGEAFRIVHRMEKESTSPNDIFAGWLTGLIYSSTSWLSEFKRRTETVVQGSGSYVAMTTIANKHNATMLDLGKTGVEHYHEMTYHQDLDLSSLPAQTAFKPGTRPGTFFPGDVNFYPWFVRDLTRWVAATISPQNPNYHIPTDEEIQYQARWIIYDW
jgi:hypothetical protein